MNASKFRPPHRNIEFFQWRISRMAFSKPTNVRLRISHFTSRRGRTLGATTSTGSNIHLCMPALFSSQTRIFLPWARRSILVLAVTFGDQTPSSKTQPTWYILQLSLPSSTLQITFPLLRPSQGFGCCVSDVVICDLCMLSVTGFSLFVVFMCFCVSII